MFGFCPAKFVTKHTSETTWFIDTKVLCMFFFILILLNENICPVSYGFVETITVQPSNFEMLDRRRPDITAQIENVFELCLPVSNSARNGGQRKDPRPTTPSNLMLSTKTCVLQTESS